jgi:hypothetical protein
MNLTAISPINRDWSRSRVRSRGRAKLPFSSVSLRKFERRGKKKGSRSRNDKLAKLTLRRSIGVGAKSFEVADKTSRTIARAFPAAGVKDSSEIRKLFRIDRRVSPVKLHRARFFSPRRWLITSARIGAAAWRRAATCNSRTFRAFLVATRLACRAPCTRVVQKNPRAHFLSLSLREKRRRKLLFHTRRLRKKKKREEMKRRHQIHRRPFFDSLDFQSHWYFSAENFKEDT